MRATVGCVTDQNRTFYMKDLWQDKEFMAAVMRTKSATLTCTMCGKQFTFKDIEPPYEYYFEAVDFHIKRCENKKLKECD